MNEQEVFNLAEYLRTYVGTEELFDFLNWPALVFLAAAFLLLWIGKKINDWITPYKINDELTKTDNKALAVSFAGYLLAIAIIIRGVLGEPAPERLLMEELGGNERLVFLGYDLLDTLVWTVVGILLLNIARFLNDKIILRQFDNIKELIQDKNVGTAAVEFGTYVGTAFIIKAVVFGGVEHWSEDIIATVVFFVLGQLAFILFGLFYQRITRYDIHAEIEKDNIAAGVAFGMNLAAIGIILSSAIEKTNSVLMFALWFVEGSLLLLLTRFLVDKLILPFARLSDEIEKDQNWGAAIIEGTAAVFIAFILNASFA